MMALDQVSGLLQSVVEFLKSCGGPYQDVTPATQENIIYSLVCGQYVIRVEDGEIVYFASFWKIQEEDIETVRQLQRPRDIYTGPLVYVVEAGCKGEVEQMARELKEANPGAVSALWHRRGRLKQFRLQGGSK